MIGFDTKSMLKLGTGVALVVAPVLSAAAEYRCDKPRTAVDERACTFAQQGPDELRRFVDRTRMIYALRFQNYRQPEDLAAGPGSPATVAMRDPTDRREPNH